MSPESRKGVVPESSPKSKKTMGGPTVLKGGVVPAGVDSTRSSQQEVSSNPVSQQEETVLRPGASSDTPAAPVVPDKDPATSSDLSKDQPASQPSKRKTREKPDYSNWNLLGLQMQDPTDPRTGQSEIRSHPVTGEVVLVPVGPDADQRSVTSAADSMPPEAGLPGR